MKWTTEITNKGAELIAQAVASGDMVFTKAVGSSTLSGAADLKTVTEVSQPQYELKLKSIEAVGNSTRLTVRLLNDGVDEAYTIRQVGIYGKLKDDSEETLISISENSVGETVPSTTTIPEWVCDLAIVLNMDNTIKPTINIPSGVYALKTDIPTTLPANGGNADTVDGLHETSFPHNRGDISDCDNAVLPGTYNATPETINTPYSGYWLVGVEIGASGTWIRQTATISDSSKPSETYRRLFINGNWSDSWIKINDGGNADTLDGLHANEIASNPNLLINPDFKINQRGKDSYTGTSSYTYTVDRWYIWKYNCDAYGTVMVNNDGSLSVDGVNGANDAILTQELENGAELIGKTVTLSLEIEELEGSILVQQHYNESSGLTVSAPGIYKVTFEWQEATKYRIVINNTNCSHYKIEWMKLELGSVATPFCPPDPATELLKIQSMNDDGTPKLISNSTLPTIMNSQMVSNPNLLINPDFSINQRGQMEYSGDTNYIYTVDCWRVGFGDGTAKSLKVESDGIVFGSSTDMQYLVQIIETPERLIGDYTLTFCVSEITGSAVIQFVDGDAVSSSTAISEPGCYSVTRTLSGTGTTGAIRLQLRSEVGATVKVRWAKLELGSVATPFCPPDPATELAKCQRYFYRIQNSAYSDVPILIHQASAQVVSRIDAVLPLPTSMRTIPTISVSNASDIIYSASSIYTDAAVSSTGISRNGVTIPYDKIVLSIEGSFTQGTSYSVALKRGGYIDFSADL